MKASKQQRQKKKESNRRFYFERINKIRVFTKRAHKDAEPSRLTSESTNQTRDVSRLLVLLTTRRPRDRDHKDEREKTCESSASLMFVRLSFAAVFV